MDQSLFCPTGLKRKRASTPEAASADSCPHHPRKDVDRNHLLKIIDFQLKYKTWDMDEFASQTFVEEADKWLAKVRTGKPYYGFYDDVDKILRSIATIDASNPMNETLLETKVELSVLCWTAMITSLPNIFEHVLTSLKAVPGRANGERAKKTLQKMRGRLECFRKGCEIVDPATRADLAKYLEMTWMVLSRDDTFEPQCSANYEYSPEIIKKVYEEEIPTEIIKLLRVMFKVHDIFKLQEIIGESSVQEGEMKDGASPSEDSCTEE